MRVPDHHVGTLAGHTQEICGLKWSPDGRYLASGANDNLLNIWQPNNNSAVHTISQHQAAVKVRTIIVLLFLHKMSYLMEKFLRCVRSSVRDKRTVIALFIAILLWMGELGTMRNATQLHMYARHASQNF